METKNQLEIEMELQLDLEIYGTSYHLISEYGEKTRLDPTKIVVTRSKSKYLKLKAIDKFIISGRGTVYTFNLLQKQKDVLKVGLKVNIELENDKYEYELNDYEITGIEMTDYSLKVGLVVKKLCDNTE